jgi:hypothetical protein
VNIRISRWIGRAVGATAAAYAAYVGVAWLRYGWPRLPDEAERDELLDRFMPQYEVADRHHVRVGAPADLALRVARDMDLQKSMLVSGIFKAREVVLGAEPDSVERPTGLLQQVTSLGWGILAESPEREIVVGCVTQPWLPNVVFRGVPADQYAAFNEPGYVKIVWTLRVDPVGPSDTIFRTETRVTTTDAASRARFRWYWARFSPGIVLIRHVMVRQVKAEAERRARQTEFAATTAR